MNYICYFILLVLFCYNCKDKNAPYQDDTVTAFTTIPESHSNVNFANRIEEIIDFNFKLQLHL